jgi:UDP-glucose:(heptosyl)LPS alpha-1,3-glucosyltransferase
MTRIALIRQRYNPFGGAERFIERALDGLRSEGVGVTLIARSWRGDSEREWIRCDPPHVGRMWRDAGFAACVRRILFRERFDLVQSHERIAGCDIYRAGDGVHATWLAQRGLTQGRLARLATRLQPWHRYTLAAEARMFRHPALRAVICNSRMVRDDIERRFAVPGEKLHVIRNGVDTAVFHPHSRARHRQSMRRDLGLDDAQPVFLYVGSGFERKGVATLLAALAGMRNREAHLLIVGTDKHRARFEKLAVRLGLGARARFLGGQADVVPFYGAADAFVLPTLYDPMPNAALEALACGLATIVSSTCGAAELIEDGTEGFVVEALDAAGLADRMDRLAAPGAARALGARARARAERHSIEAMTRQLTALYARLLASRPV